MKNFIRKDRILIALAILGLIASLIPVAARVRAEEANKYYDLVLDYPSIRAMALQSEYDEGEWLDMLREYGADKIALGEVTAKTMSASAVIPVYAASVKEIRSGHGWEKRYPATVARWVGESVDMADALVIAETPEAYDWVQNAFDERAEDFTCLRYADAESGAGFLFIPRQESGLSGEKMLDLCLGIWPETAQFMADHGMTVIPRTATVDGLNGAKFAESFLRVLKEYDSPYFLNSGDSLLGYDDEAGEKLLKDYLRESGVGVGLIEQNDQSQNLVWDGIEKLLDETGYHAVRMFNEWAYIQNRYEYCGYEGAEEITNSFFRAIAERNCKIVYMRMILEPDNDVKPDAKEEKWTYITDPADYEQLLGDLDTRLSAIGYRHGTVPPMELDTPSRLCRIVEGIGVVALCVLLLDLFFYLDDRWRYGLLALGVLGVVGLAFVKPHGYQLLLSLAGGIVMPAIAGTALCRAVAGKRRAVPQPKLGGLLVYCIGMALVTILLSFGSSILATSALTQLSYLVEMDLYRGVKIMQLIPIGVFGLAYLLVYAYEESGAKTAVLAHIGERGEKGRMERFKTYFAEVMRQPMKLGWMVGLVLVVGVGAFVLLAGVYYIYRTGNSTNVSAAELQFRNFLENTLIARPRTKEFLIGWPCLMLFIWALRRQMNFLPLLFGLCASIGLVSIVNTFLHIRTPFLLSLLRTGWGVLFGLAIGIALVCVAELVYRLVKKYIGGAHG